MDHAIQHNPTFSLLKVSLKPGESVRAEAGAMVGMSPGVDIQTKAQGGILSALKRRFLGGESFFQNVFTAPEGGEVSFAPPYTGDITTVSLDGTTVLAEKSAYIASAGDVNVSTKWGGFKSARNREGFFLLHLTGKGTVWLSSFGAVEEMVLFPNEKYILDTGHVVAFDDTVQYAVRKVGGIKSSLFSGEGRVAEFTGPGRLWMQTRSVGSWAAWMQPFLPKAQRQWPWSR